jgi:hypothetical protein
MSNPNSKYRIKLSKEQRQELIAISKNGTKSAKQVNHAQARSPLAVGWVEHRVKRPPQLIAQAKPNIILIAPIRTAIAAY